MLYDSSSTPFINNGKSAQTKAPRLTSHKPMARDIHFNCPDNLNPSVIIIPGLPSFSKKKDATNFKTFLDPAERTIGTAAVELRFQSTACQAEIQTVLTPSGSTNHVLDEKQRKRNKNTKCKKERIKREMEDEIERRHKRGSLSPPRCFEYFNVGSFGFRHAIN